MINNIGVTVRRDRGMRETDGTTDRDDMGYEAHIVVVQRTRSPWDPTGSAIEMFLENVTRHFHNQRRMAAVTAERTDVCQIPSKVIPGPRPPRANEFKDYTIDTLTVVLWFRSSRTPQSTASP